MNILMIVSDTFRPAGQGGSRRDDRTLGVGVARVVVLGGDS